MAVGMIRPSTHGRIFSFARTVSGGPRVHRPRSTWLPAWTMTFHARQARLVHARRNRRDPRGSRGRRLVLLAAQDVLVGLAEAAVRESTHRVERAIVNSGYRRPIDRVIINLAPADLKKDAGGFDLPIALGLLLGSGQVAFDRPGSYRHRRRAGPHRRDPAHQGRPGHGLAGRRREPRRPARPRRQRPRGRRRRGAQRHPHRQPRRGRRLPLRPARHRAPVRQPRRGLPPALAHRGGLRRRQGPGLRQAGDPDRRGRLRTTS